MDGRIGEQQGIPIRTVTPHESVGKVALLLMLDGDEAWPLGLMFYGNPTFIAGPARV
jgi:hypothetical protein